MSSAAKKSNQSEPRQAHPAAAKSAPPIRDEIEVARAAPIEWNYVVSCEARNALQVVLSGGEILLDQQFGTLTTEQRGVLVKMMDNARHLNSLIATLHETERQNPTESSTVSRRATSYIGGRSA